MTRLLYDEAQAREMLGGIGRTTLYELIGSGRLHTTKIGRRTFFAADELERFVEALKAGAAA